MSLITGISVAEKTVTEFYKPVDKEVISLSDPKQNLALAQVFQTKQISSLIALGIIIGIISLFLSNR